MLTSTRFLQKTFALCFSLFFVALTLPPALAFVDTSALQEELQKTEQELAPDAGLGSLLDQLESAAGSKAGNYLQTTLDGKNVTVWDVPKDAWFYPHVLALMELNVVSGYKDATGNPTGAYGPGDNVTREQAMKIALGAAGVDVSGCRGNPASRKVSEWAKPFAICATSMNFGIKEGTDLTAPATRAEVLHYLLLAFAVPAPAGTPPFADAKTNMYKNDIAYAYALGVVSGDTNADGSLKGTFRPDAAVNRAETAKMAKLATELF